MTKRWPVQWFPTLLVCFLLVACSNQPNGAGSKEKDEISKQLGTVEKVSVLSTDGTEIPLDLQEFSTKIVEQGKPLQRAETPLAASDVKFTLIVYRTDLAPLVIEVGTKSSQLGDFAYSGEGAEAFYQWTRRMIGQSLFTHEGAYTMLLTADDQGSTHPLSQEESAFVWKSLQEAKYQEKLEQVVYPLYPYYRLKLDVGDRVLDATVLTPSLLSVRFGNEVLYYRVPGALFSQLTEWIPPHPIETDTFDALFKATKVQISASDKNGEASWVIAESIEGQGRAHQLVRLFKQGTLTNQPVQLPKQPVYTLEFQLQDSKERIDLNDKWFTYKGSIYAHRMIIDNVRHILAIATTKTEKTQK
ncbi:hypothetical protein LOK74_06330 [Brevibacillus humidisoli]|uniref:hypothetical protein n=1 Tax=Brevibacillus humidisoli TaxID=2895522 RepID=UPI001E5C9D56|nr:hypothetical protein [Brevibacillus humidisoli]UFJ42111.1 hypothetical protein LOK74_06330 [Brevibacillus humidisoli]